MFKFKATVLLALASAAFPLASCEGDDTIMGAKPGDSAPAQNTEVSDGPPPGDPEMADRDVVFEATRAEICRYGEDYGDLGAGYCDWSVYLSTDGSDDLVELDFFTGKDMEGIPFGNFEIRRGADGYLFEPGCALPFHYDETEDIGYGCLYVHNQTFWFGATDGSLSIREAENGIRIEYDMFDSKAGAGFRGVFEGVCPVYDESDGKAIKTR